MNSMYYGLEQRIKEWHNVYDIYFQVHCLYNAKTELFDRTLTDKRSPYDPTAAFLTSDVRSSSHWYSMKLYEKCRTYIEIKTHSLFNSEFWRKCIGNYHNLSAQGWIDLYEHLIEENKISADMLNKIYVK